MLNSKLNLAFAAVLWFAGISVALAQKESPLLTQSEDKLIAVLKSDAPQKEKADACRELGVIGTKQAVAALAALLADEKMNHMARYALEPNPDPSVDAALRDALGKLKGRPLVGVIGSIGVRRDARATDALARFLADADPDVAQAAARALGKIGNSAAVKALLAALTLSAPGNQVAVCEGLFRCAEALSAKGQRREATVIYDHLFKGQGPHQVRAAAVRGAILSRGQDGLALLKQHLGSRDYIVFAAAVRTSMEMPGADVTKTLVAELSRLVPDNQVVLLQTLGLRSDAAALPALSAMARAGEKPVRLAAIKAMPMIGQASVVPVLTGLLADPDREIAQTSQESLAALPGKTVDDAVLAMLNGNDTARRLIAIDLIARRRMLDALPALQKAAGDADAKVRPAAIKRLGELGSTADLPALIDLLMQAKGQDLDAAEQAVGAVCAKSDNPEAATEKLANLMAQAQPAQKGALLSVLSAIGGTKALEAVRAAVNDSNAEVRAGAIRALGGWKTAEVAPDLLALAQNASSPGDKTLCLRAYLSLAANTDVPADQRLSMCREAAGLAQKPEEKKLLLAALGGLNSPDALALITPHLEDAATKAEASTAAVTVAEKLVRRRDAGKLAPRLVAAMEKVVQAAANADLTKRAQSVLQQAQSKAGGR
jgi:HEAT repeat protein